MKKTAKKDCVTFLHTVNPEEINPTMTADTTTDPIHIQVILCRIGTSLGFNIWLPVSARSHIVEIWAPRRGELLDELPLEFESSMMKGIEKIDVLWISRCSIVRAFVFESTSSKCTGLLTLVDLSTRQPKSNIKLHLVAESENYPRVAQDFRNSAFAVLEGRNASEICTFLSYESIQEIAGLKFYSHLADRVISDFENAI